MHHWYFVCQERVESPVIVSLKTRPSNPQHWIKIHREVLRDCPYHFGSVHQDLGWPIRLQNVSDVTHLNNWATKSILIIEFYGPKYFTKADSIVEKLHNSQKGLSEYQLACFWHHVGEYKTWRHVNVAYNQDPKQYRQSPRSSLCMFSWKN